MMSVLNSLFVIFLILLIPSITSEPSVKPSFKPSAVPTLYPTQKIEAPTIFKRGYFNTCPAYVYSNVTYYTKRDIASSLYSFSFQLSELPSESLIVTPLVFGLSSNSYSYAKDIQIFPSSFEFRPNSNPRAFFYLTAPSTLQYSYMINLVVTGGSSYAEYEYIRNAEATLAHYSPLTLIPVDGPLPGPQMLKAIFSDGGNGFVVIFDSPTDQMGITAAAWNCSSLFQFIQVTTSTCSWTNSSTVMVTFGTNPSIYMYDKITLNGDLLKGQCTRGKCEDNFFAAGAIVNLEPALNPITPQPVI